MELVWQSSEPPARKRSLQACENCRSRKKRCYHVDKVKKVKRVESVGRVERVETVPEAPSEITTRESSSSPGRVSNYNPESVLAGLSEGPESVPSVERLDSGQAQRPGFLQLGEPSPSAAQLAQRRLLWYKRHKRRATPPKLSEHHRRYLQDAGALLELPRATTDALLPIYISLLDDLIPVLDGANVFRDHSNGQSSIYLVRAMCLVTCKTQQATPFLRLSADGPLLDPLDFASKLLAGLDAAIKADLEPDRVIKVQVLALMHLHNDGLAGVDRSSSYLSQAICEAWSLSLQWETPGNSDQDECNFLWWTLRNFDRLNKPVSGAAPFIIDDADVAIDRITPRKDSYRSQLMAVALSLGDLMKTATKVYKASSTAIVDDCEEFPSLASLTGANFDHFHKSHRAYLEVWYHVAAMLSCRYSGPGSTQYNRRLASADRILEIISQGGHESLPPLPLVPYAMSMSTTAIYRALYDDTRGIETAYKDLRLCCDALDALSHRWTSAKGVAKLAKRLWRLTNPESSNWQLGDDNDHIHKGRSLKDGTAAAIGQSSALISQGSNETTNREEDLMPMPVSTQIDPSLHREQASDTSESFQRQLIEAWPGIDASGFQLDWAFQDLFDYGMPNVLRDPGV